MRGSHGSIGSLRATAAIRSRTAAPGSTQKHRIATLQKIRRPSSTSPPATTDSASPTSSPGPATPSLTPSSNAVGSHVTSARSRAVRSKPRTSSRIRSTSSRRPASAASSAARNNRRARSPPSPRAAARSRARTAATAPPRRSARSAVFSSRQATFSSAPVAAPARCHARRSGSSVAQASRRWASWRSERLAAPAIADLINGCRNAPSRSTSLASTAGARSAEGTPPSAKASNDARTSAGRTEARAAKDSSRELPPNGSSVSANGFPAAWASTHERRSGSRPGATASSTATDSGESSGAKESVGTPSKTGVRAARTRTAPVRRRATNPRTSWLAWSSQCASSTRTTGRAALSTSSAASPTRCTGGAGPSASPRTTSSAPRRAPDNVDRSRNGCRTWCSPA